MTSPTPVVSRIPRIDPAWTRLSAAVVACGLLTWAGVRAQRRASASNQEAASAQAVLADFAALRRRYEPAVAAESIAWRRTALELRRLGISGDERLDLTRTVTRAAESAGLQDVRVLIGPADTTGLERRLSTEGIERTPASFSLVVEGLGGMRSVIDFLGQLPPSVAATQLSLARQNGRGRHRISLAVYEINFTNGALPSTLWSSLERGPAGGGSGARPGG